jgi:ABC-type multidrug transport system ATPase subunit
VSAGPGAPAVALRGIWKYFGDFPALRDVTFDVPSGACLALLGRNGAGKTTLLKILCGLSSASKGAADLPPREQRGIIGHGIGIYDELSAEENLLLFARLYSAPNPRSVVDHWLQRVNLAHVRSARAREFSRGMRQRLALARTFLHEPKLLLLDEPFTSLDDRAIALLQDLLRERLAAGSTVIMSTHQLREAMELSTHAALLVRGKVAFFDSRPAEMLHDPSWLYRTHGEAA